jgi:hypothetical protein
VNSSACLQDALARVGGSMVMVCVDDNGNLNYWWQGGTAWNWQQVAAAGSGASYGDPSITWTGSSVVIAAVNYETAGSGWSSMPWSSWSMARMMRRQISRSCRD